jgi:hypothetical protein
MIFRWLKNLRQSKPEKIAAIRADYPRFLSEDLSDEDYERIYKGDKVKIAAEKEAWYQSGLKVIESNERMFRSMEDDE